MIRYIIDGHNVINSVPKYLTLLDHDYPACLRMLCSDVLNYTYCKKVRIVLVFDGNPPWKPPERTDALTISFSGKQRDGDAVISEQARKWKGRQTVVVTGDRALQRLVAPYGCQTMAPAEFYRLLTGKKKNRQDSFFSRSQKFRGLTEREVRWWKVEMEKEAEKKKKRD